MVIVREQEGIDYYFRRVMFFLGRIFRLVIMVMMV